MVRALGLLFVLISLAGPALVAQEQRQAGPELTPEARKQVEEEATRHRRAGNDLVEAAKFPEAEQAYRQSLQRLERLYPRVEFPDGHSDLVNAMVDVAFTLRYQSKLAQAEPLLQDALAMARKLYPPGRVPDGHADLLGCLNELGSLLRTQGKPAQAEPLLREALAMARKLSPPDRFPEGDVTLATTMDNLATLLQKLDKLDEAEPLMREALELRRKLFPPAQFPDSHPELVISLNNLGTLLRERGKLEQAAQFLRQALELTRKLCPPNRFPDGHSDLIDSMNNLAFVLNDLGRTAQAETLHREALAMARALYPPSRFPDGHEVLARTLHVLAALLRDQGRPEQAVPLFQEALAMHQRLSLDYAQTRSEGDALTMIASFPGHDDYLSLVQRHPAFAPQAYDALWGSRNRLARLAEQKHLAARAAAVSPDYRARWEELKELRRQRVRLLLQPRPAEVRAVAERDRQLADLDRRINDLAAQAREKLPAWSSLQQRDRGTPADLQRLLPEGTVVVDLHAYALYMQDRTRPGVVGKAPARRYIAFLVTKDRIHHIDLGPAAPIEEALQRWREELTRRDAPPAADAPRTLRRLLWEPLEKQFPAGTTTVYLCPVQALCFLPWAALPGRKPDSVVLEEYGLAIVPDGPRLLGQLAPAAGTEARKSELLLIGGVSYDEAASRAAVPATAPQAEPFLAGRNGWRSLPGTAMEAASLAVLARRRQFAFRLLGGQEAGTEQVKAALTQARHAHLATHGYFADARFRSAFQMDEKLFAIQGDERIGIGALNPSILSGLVFAGANRPETPGRGILTAEELLDLDLTGMELAVLSACETGLGDTAGGEGVFGLQRAFHVAGCRNVVASLWKVNDVATLVLMEEFYRNLWEKKLSKREALRQAQLTVYRNPDMVEKRRQDLLAELKKAGATREQLALRGIEDDAAPLPAVPPGTVRRSPAAWWAAFVLSGVGD